MLHLALSLALLQPTPRLRPAAWYDEVESERPARRLSLDPQLGRVVPLEAFAGVGGFLAADLAAAALIFGGGFGQCLAPGSDSCVVTLATTLGVPTQVLAGPLLAALVPWLIADEPLGGSLLRAMAYSLLANTAVGVACLAVGFAVPTLVVPMGIAYLAGGAVASAVAASFGLHGGPAFGAAPAPPAARPYDPQAVSPPPLWGR